MINIDYDDILNKLELQKILCESLQKNFKLSKEDASKIANEIIDKGIDQSKTIIDKALYEMAHLKK